jgi:hypothetical protein
LQLEFDAGKFPGIFDTLLGLRIPQLVDQVCYETGPPCCPPYDKREDS